ncbi:MAG: glucose-1-phosphate cytidylyltransferase [Bacteroidales bacterium]|nr:glucose-1-phosphate cytidylyltransferase [Bacteroidales bacterium]
MKAVLLAGGFGTRIAEESHLKPKPMIEIGGKPILWHIMKHYASYGINEFIICAGYKQHVIKEWFANYYLHTNDITFDLSEGSRLTIHSNQAEPWKVTVVDTGLNTMTGGRIKRIQPYIGEETFLLTYGDGVSDVDIQKTIDWHRRYGKLATMTAILPESRFGVLDLDGAMVTGFREKNQSDSGWINAGFMVLEPGVFDYIAGDETVFERAPLENLVQDKELICYKHTGFWQCMDTLRDKEKLEKLWESGQAPWKTWTE